MPPRKNFMPDPASMFDQLQALVAEKKRRGVPRADTARREATRKQNLKAKQEAAAERWHEARKAKRKPPTPYGERVADRVVRAMEPGEWYADRDLQNALGVPEDYPVQLEALRLGLIHKRPNPEWRGQNRYGEMQAPKYLFQLTPLGEALRASVGLLA